MCYCTIHFMSTYFHFILLDIKLQIHCQFLMIELDLVPYQGLKQLINDTKYIMLCTTIATPTNINSHQIHPDPDSYLILRIFSRLHTQESLTNTLCNTGEQEWMD